MPATGTFQKRLTDWGSPGQHCTAKSESMSFKKFDLLVILQLLLITLTNFVIAWSIIQEHLRVSTVYFTILLILQIIFLSSFLTRQNKEVLRFLESMKHRDDLTRLTEKSPHSQQRELRRLLNEIAESYSKVKIEKESEHQYFLNAIRHLNIGLISYDESGRIEIANEAAEKLLKISRLKHISQIHLPGSNGITVTELVPGKPKLVKQRHEDGILRLSLHTTSFTIKDRKITLLTIQDIRNEIQQEEIEIWQKLIRVLTHEIMNSAGPITSLSATLTDTFREEIKPHAIGEKTWDQVLIGLQAIQKRSRGLARFVETYRNLTKLPKPVFTAVNGSELLQHLYMLMKEELERERIALYTDVEPEDLMLTIDEKMFTQVLINLARNSIEALRGRPDKSIRIRMMEIDNGRISLVMEDNGIGIPEEVMERIFVPFFTTRENGSGIGLSLSRQIMSLHEGTINVWSKEGEGTRVELLL